MAAKKPPKEKKDKRCIVCGRKCFFLACKNCLREAVRKTRRDNAKKNGH